MGAERHGGSHHHTRTVSRSGPLTARSPDGSARTGMMLSKRTIAGVAMMTTKSEKQAAAGGHGGKDFNNSAQEARVVASAV